MDDRGDLWVGTDRGAGVFDGESFDSRDSEDHLAGPSVRRIVEDPDGTLWFACDMNQRIFSHRFQCLRDAPDGAHKCGFLRPG